MTPTIELSDNQGSSSTSETVGTFGNHPSHRSNKHLSSSRHQESLKNKLMMNFEKNTNMYKLLQKASLPQAALKTNNYCVFETIQIQWKDLQAFHQNFTAK